MLQSNWEYDAISTTFEKKIKFILTNKYNIKLFNF